MRIDPKAWKARRQWAVDSWEQALAKGRHPTKTELAKLVEDYGTPTLQARKYVAARLRGENSATGTTPMADADHMEKLRRAHRLHEAVELRYAAFRLQKVPQPKDRAREEVARMLDLDMDPGDFNRRHIRDPLTKGSGGWRLDGPLITEDEALRRIQDNLDAGEIKLDPRKGWVPVPDGKGGNE